jgi:thiosulfate reductase cytochrome b subunit
MNLDLRGWARFVALAFVLVWAAPAAASEGAANPMHPAFKPLTAEGAVAPSKEAVSVSKTCGACHDASAIEGRASHDTPHADVSCAACHVAGEPRWDKRDADGFVRLDIAPPRAESCAPCHGLVKAPEAAVLLPDAWGAALGAGRTTSLTLGEGAIVSAQHAQDSFLNLAGKSALTSPWDVHAAKLVDCVACHHAANNPGRADGKRDKLGYVAFDPRRLGIATYLKRPDHHLAKPACRSCHEPDEGHAFLPYRARHMDKLACAACHEQDSLAPAAEAIDETVVAANGEPSVLYRNRDGDARSSPNSALVRPLRPLLVLRRAQDGVERLSPVNLITRFRFVTGAGNVPFSVVKQAYFEGERYAPSVLRAFDADGDGTLSPRELRLDAPEKLGAIQARLADLGVDKPVVAGEIEVHALAHGVPGRERALRSCDACHVDGSRFAGDYDVTSYVPGGAELRLPTSRTYRFEGELRRAGEGMVFRHAESSTAKGLYLLGVSRATTSNQLGFGLFTAVVLALGVHALARVWMRFRNGAPHPLDHRLARRDYIFGRYERLWHWTMALSGTVLMGSGLAIHTGAAPSSDLRTVVFVHNGAATVLMLNAFLGFFYHSATAAIRQFIPEPKGLMHRMLEHVDYQARGIFYSGAHPRNAPGAKLNPLQQLTYLMLLNFLFPLQIITGLLMWAVGEWPALSREVGPLAQVAPLHNLGSWLFLTFFVLHVYLVTTGRTVGEHLNTMVTGYRDSIPPPGAGGARVSSAPPRPTEEQGA